MGQRLDLQAIFEHICPNVYFQAPANVQMNYPAIVYERGRAESSYADDLPYTVIKQYAVTLITRDPDESIFEVLAALPMCRHERFFVVDNLNHDVFNIYF